MRKETYQIKFLRPSTLNLVKLLCKKRKIKINTFLNEAIEREVKEQAKTLDSKDIQILINSITK